MYLVKSVAVLIGIKIILSCDNISNDSTVVKATGSHRYSPGSIPERSKTLPTSCHEIGVCKPRDGRDMRLCADKCVAGLLVGSCGWVVNQDGVRIEVCWRSAGCEGGPGCGQLEQKPDGQGASMEAEWATSHG